MLAILLEFMAVLSEFVAAHIQFTVPIPAGDQLLSLFSLFPFSKVVRLH